MYFSLASDLRHPPMRAIANAEMLRCLLATALALGATTANAQALPASCGALTNGYGPFDYRTSPDKRQMVEPYHFSPEVEALIRGKSGYLEGDIDYTLRAFPNHPRALNSMMRLAERVKMDKVPQASYSVECYFLRGIAFMPDDSTVRMLFATYLGSKKRREEAMAQLSLVKKQAGDNPFTHYNLGLVYADLGALDEALVQAHEALALGFPRTELRERLIKANKWAEPASAPQ